MPSAPATGGMSSLGNATRGEATGPGTAPPSRPGGVLARAPPAARADPRPARAAVGKLDADQENKGAGTRRMIFTPLRPGPAPERRPGHLAPVLRRMGLLACPRSRARDRATARPLVVVLRDTGAATWTPGSPVSRKAPRCIRSCATRFSGPLPGSRACPGFRRRLPARG
ncbi:MAG: hypothetical protein JWR00_2021 [Rubritepida sp.]|nr:hypothetical protein [Rubritepida sp.]